MVTKVKLTSLSTEALLDLRQKVDDELKRHRDQLEANLRSIDVPAKPMIRSRKVAPKYRGPDGETWAGRGAVPRWMRAAMKATGQKREAFRI